MVCGGGEVHLLIDGRLKGVFVLLSILLVGLGRAGAGPGGGGGIWETRALQSIVIV